MTLLGQDDDTSYFLPRQDEMTQSDETSKVLHEALAHVYSQLAASSTRDSADIEVWQNFLRFLYSLGFTMFVLHITNYKHIKKIIHYYYYLSHEHYSTLPDKNTILMYFANNANSFN